MHREHLGRGGKVGDGNHESRGERSAITIQHLGPRSGRRPLALSCEVGSRSPSNVRRWMGIDLGQIQSSI
jgi:hypothetical protein